MNKKTWIRILIGAGVLLTVLILGLLLYIRPSLSDDDLTMAAVKMNQDGEILAEGDIVLRGKILTTRYQPSYIYLKDAKFVDMTDLSAEKSRVDAHLYDIFGGFGFGYSPISGKLHDATLGAFVFTGSIYDDGFCVFELQLPDEDVIVVGSKDAQPDWQRYLEKYQQDKES